MLQLVTLKVNQTIVKESDMDTFFSYDTPICSRMVDGEVVLYTDWCYSPTTSKYRSQFLNGETTKETQKKLDEGTYTLRRPYAKD